ncbi:MAG: 4-hydroxy-tetrahydrodipicolinate reductase [Bacteroidales bacterium]|nr:4-hydroxy-tetrahydrodipicolinate reductase [Bacteroidales bacterium]
MNIAIIGYGKMGKEIEKLIEKSNHTLVSIIDSEEEWEEYEDELEKADVAIEFSTPSSVVSNIQKCFDRNLPIVVGTTGWNDAREELKNLCLEKNQSLVWGANFSVGVNMFFAVNKKLAEMMASYPEFEVDIEEVHHTAKLDSPSGTALFLANDIVKTVSSKLGETESPSMSTPVISSKRISNTPGTHIVSYQSDNETIEIKHMALNRKNFAQGALLAAEWIVAKKGFYSVKDVYDF